MGSSFLNTCHPPHGKDKNVALSLKASTSARPHCNVPRIPSKVRATGGALKYNFLFTAIILRGTPQGCSLQLGSCALHNSKGHHSHLFNGLGLCDGPVSCHLHFHLKSLLSGRKEELEYLGLCIFFFFPTKGLLPVSALTPKAQFTVPVH